MRRRAAHGALALLAAGPAPLAAQAPAITVGPNVHVSAANALVNHSETVIAAHPRDPAILLACAMHGLAPGRRSGVAAYRSSDGGRSWQPAVRSTRHFAGDPSCLFDGAGRAYVAAKTNHRQPPEGAWASDTDSLTIQVSRDGGATWDAPRQVLQANDRPWLAVDTTARRSAGAVYAVLDGHEHLRAPAHANEDFRHLLVVGRSLDVAQSFPQVVTRALPEQASDRQHASLACGMVVLSDGTLLVLQHHMLLAGAGGSGKLREVGGTLEVHAVTDGGRSLDSIGSLGSVVSGYNQPASRGITGAIAADPGSTAARRDRVYVVWADYASGRGVIRLAASADRGRSWSAADPVAPDSASLPGDRFMPTIAVNRHGVIGVLWYDRRGVADAEDYRPRFSASLDGGVTWLPSVVLSSSSNARRQQRAGGPGGRNGTYLPNGGDTAGLVADAAGRFHALWIDNRTGVQQAWTSVVEVHAAARQRERLPRRGDALW